MRPAIITKNAITLSPNENELDRFPEMSAFITVIEARFLPPREQDRRFTVIGQQG